MQVNLIEVILSFEDEGYTLRHVGEPFSRITLTKDNLIIYLFDMGDHIAVHHARPPPGQKHEVFHRPASEGPANYKILPNGEIKAGIYYENGQRIR